MGNKGTSNRRAAERLLDEFSIREHWMPSSVRTVAPSDSIERASELLNATGSTSYPSLAAGNYSEMVTDRDIRRSAGLRGGAAATRVANQRVESVMSLPAIALGCRSTLLNAAKVMRRSRIGSVPILRGETLAGIVTRSDILDAFVGLANGRYYRKPPKRSSIR